VTRLAPPLTPLTLLALAALFAVPAPALAAGAAEVPWWVWPAALFAVSFLLGIVAVLGGVGGAVLFVPLVSGFFPFHLDFVRAAGLMLALGGALAAGPQLLRAGLASLRLAMPLALFGTVGAMAGAGVGLALPDRLVQIALGLTILAVASILVAAEREGPGDGRMDRWGMWLGLRGAYRDERHSTVVRWEASRVVPGVAAFTVIGFAGGLFGLGAGWASVPVLNLIMGAPLKVAAATSGFSITVMNTGSTWVYLNHGAVLPILTVPSILGVMLGAVIGARLLQVASSRVVRWVVILLLFASGLRALAKGLGA
jgi:uncharacterized membrane protein YfcA